jgi:predicted amidohydrolase YtcJ
VLQHRGDETQVVDLDGQTVVPGLIDAHGHFKSLGEVKLELDLVQTTSYDEAVEMVRRRAKELESGTWIVGRRWDQANWGLQDFPTHRELSEAVPEHPVYLTRVDGHAALVNAKALELAGITDETPDPDGGDILRDADGHATGVLVDNASDLVSGVIERQRLPLADLARAAQEACFQVGLTSVHDAGTPAGEIPRWKQLYDSGLLKIRLYVMLSGGRGITDYFAENQPLVGYADNRLTVRACKLFVDGAMGSRGAWMLEPYADKPVNDEGEPYTGLVLMTPPRIRQIAVAGLKHGYQVCTHAIGDRGNREVLDAYASAFKVVPVDDPRFRIEHAQCVALEDIPRFAELGVIPSMQQTHATSDMRWAEDRVGPQRVLGCYAWRRFYDAGCRIAGGSDFPVEHENPLLGFYAGITRQNVNGEPPGGWYADQCQTREEALRSLTIDAAYASFEEDLKGSLEAGKLADFVVLDRDIMKVQAAEVPGTKVLQTVVGGEVVFRAPRAPGKPGG